MNFHPRESIAIFIDGPNLHSSARALGFDIDYRKLLELFGSQGRLVRAFYYTALIDDQEYSPLRPLVDWLDYNGYTMVTKPAKEFTDAMGHRRIKGNMDIEIAVDMMEMGRKVDHIVLFSGDGDFRRLIEAVQREGVRVSVVSTLRTSPSMVADELRRQTDAFIELQDLTPHSSPRGHRDSDGKTDDAVFRTGIPRMNPCLSGDCHTDCLPGPASCRPRDSPHRPDARRPDLRSIARVRGDHSRARRRTAI